MGVFKISVNSQGVFVLELFDIIMLVSCSIILRNVLCFVKGQEGLDGSRQNVRSQP